MVIFGRFNMGDVPFKDVFIHPVIQDGEGKRMSKTLGNGIDPVDIIEQYGADALRFTLAGAATETQDLRIPVEWVKDSEGRFASRTAYGSPIEWLSAEVAKLLPKDRRVNTSERFEQGRNFANKFWNAARFSLMNLEGYEPAPVSWDELPAEDRWILSGLARVEAETRLGLEAFRFADVARDLRDFTWNRFCDWYVEFVKDRLRDPDARPLAQRVLATVLDGLCRLLHPIMPFVTEQVWQALGTVAPLRGLPDAAAGRGERLHRRLAVVRLPARDPGGRGRPPVAGEDHGVAEPPRRAGRAQIGQDRAHHRRGRARGGPSTRKGEAFLLALTDSSSITIVAQADRPANSAVTVLADCRGDPAVGGPDRPGGGGGPQSQGAGGPRQAARGGAREARQRLLPQPGAGGPRRPAAKGKLAELEAQRSAVLALLGS